jgi:hypothetical protein
MFVPRTKNSCIQAQNRVGLFSPSLPGDVHRTHPNTVGFSAEEYNGRPNQQPSSARARTHAHTHTHTQMILQHPPPDLQSSLFLSCGQTAIVCISYLRTTCYMHNQPYPPMCETNRSTRCYETYTTGVEFTAFRIITLFV